MSNLVIKFEEIKPNDILLVGGKGLALGELANAGFPVPEGFVICSETFEKFLNDNNISGKINEILNKLEEGNIANSAKEIQQLIANCEINMETEEAIYRLFDEEKLLYVAVRSSATAEDNPKMSWAGELETFLYVNKNDLLQRIKDCWSSLYSPRALTYRLEKMVEGDIKVAVVIQKMVPSEIAGIAFTVHPVTKNKNEIFIEAGFGLGEYVVGGDITPDKYVIDKNDFAFLSAEINQQEKMLIFDGAIVSSKDVPRAQKKTQKIEGKKIIELAKMTKDIEDHYKFPCDIEWALEKGKIYILQSRPITTL
ncbi:MAG: PEP/pyruvate-binding domain-containing protein [Patescibacteria group bacterium]|jgi:pyruvate,water dikinase